MNIKLYSKGLLVLACCGVLLTSCSKEDSLEPGNSAIQEPQLAPPAGAASERSGDYEWGKIPTAHSFDGVTPNNPAQLPTSMDGALKGEGDLDYGQIQTSFDFANTPMVQPNQNPSTLDDGSRIGITTTEPDCGYPLPVMNAASN